jgi:hypothetical protein
MKKLTSEELKETFINNLLNMTEVIQKVQLVEGKFTPSEAADVISALISEKINFHKLKRLSKLEGNETADCSQTSSRIKELEDERMIAREFIKIAKMEGYNLKINGTLEISFDE